MSDQYTALSSDCQWLIFLYNFRMSGKVKQRSAANTSEAATTSVNEKILKRCHSLYTETENGMFVCVFI